MHTIEVESNDPVNSCWVEGCEGEPERQGLCFKHYMRLRRHGNFDDPPPPTGRAPKYTGIACSEKDCKVQAMSRGMCKPHYAKWLRGGQDREARCSICPRPAYSNGLCGMHYGRLRNHGSTDNPRTPELEAFWAKVDKNGPIPPSRPDLGPCWIWMNAKSSGYGKFRTYTAHVYSWELANGPLPVTRPRITIDHLCRTPACVRPTHLEAVPQRENTRRAWSSIEMETNGAHCQTCTCASTAIAAVPAQAASV